MGGDVYVSVGNPMDDDLRERPLENVAAQAEDSRVVRMTACLQEGLQPVANQWDV